MTDSTTYFRVRNLDKYQHYKDRSPPWIKLHQATLDDYHFAQLPDTAKAHLMCIWLIAARADNKLPFDPDWIAHAIHAKSTVDLDILLAGRFIEAINVRARRKQSASKTLATCLQDARPETERETKGEERRDRGETKVSPGRSRSPPKPSKSGEIWLSYSEAYERRYGAKPVRNATVNACLCKFVDRVGAEEAPDIAAWYLRSENHLYYASGHSVQMLLRDAEKIRTEWATGRTITNTRARQRDQAQTQFNNAEEAVRILKKEGSWKD